MPASAETVGAVRRTPRFRALHFDFAVESDVAAIVDYVGRIYRHLELPGEAAARYRFGVEDHEDGEPRYLVELDGTPIMDTRSPSVALNHLLWHINRQVVDTASDLLLFHSSAAAAGDTGVLFPAPMESGKTTLIAGLTRAGLAYVTDEAAAIHPETLQLLPYPKPLSVDPGSWDVLRSLEPTIDDEVAPFLGNQWHVDPLSIHDNAVAPVTTPRFVIAPRYQPNKPTTLTPLRPAAAAVLLAENCFNLHPLGRRGFETLIGLVRQCECYSMSVRTLDEAVATVFEVLGLEAPA